MPTTPLRGAGFHPTSPMPYANLRSQNENKAQLILNAKQDRDVKEKEQERVLKEADRVLKQRFDSAKTEATLHGLPQGQASVMSLGQLDGWVKATRKIKVDEQEMLEMEERRQRMEQARKEQDRKNQGQKDQENALRLINFINRDTSKTEWNEQNVQRLSKLLGMKPNSNMMNAYYGMKQKMRSQGPIQVQGVKVPGQWARANVMTGGGMAPTMLPPKAPPFDPDQIKGIDVDGDGVMDTVTGPPGMDFKMLARPGSGSGGSSDMQLTTRPDGSQVLVNKRTGKVTPVPGGEPPPSAHTADDIGRFKLRNKEIRKQMDQMRSQGGSAPGSTSWSNKMKSLTDELKENNRIISDHRPPKPQPQAQAQAQATPAPVKFDDYFDAQGKLTPKFINLVASDRAEAVKVLKQLVKQGDLTADQVRDIIKNIN